MKQYTEDGRALGGWVSRPTATGKRKYWIAKSGYQFGVALLAWGFLLQLLDLLRG